EPAALPDELPAELAGHVGQPDRGGIKISSEPSECTREVGSELVLQRRKRGRGGRAGAGEPSLERGRSVPQRDGLVGIGTGRGVVDGEIEALTQRTHRRAQSV